MKKALRFVIIPKVAHPWFDEVVKGAHAQAVILGRELGVDMVVDYLPPAVADPAAQMRLLEKARSGQPDGIALDPVDAIGNLAEIGSVMEQGIPLVLFDSPSPDRRITSIGTDFTRQGEMAAERLVEMIHGRGKVAVMQGYPTAPNHKERYDAQLNVLRRYPGIHIVDGGTDNDDIETAFSQAASVIASYPDLAGYLCCDAAGPIGIARAVKTAGKLGIIKVVGMDGIRPILDAIKEGVIQASSASVPQMQGSMSILMLWQATLGVPLPEFVDTGVVMITQENIDKHLDDAGKVSGLSK